MTVLADAKIDCHIHTIDPARFPYAPETPYRPSGQEVAPIAHLMGVHDAFNVRHALLVGTNSGYGTDNRCLLDALARGNGRFKGIAVVDNSVDAGELARLKGLGVVGVAFNVPFMGEAYYRDAGPLVDKLADLGLLLQIQVEHDQLLALLPLLAKVRVPLLIDHCGRPSVAHGLGQPGFQALLALGRERDAWIKLSGLYKFACEPHPYRDTWPFVEALVEAFTLDRCLWGSDWPFLRAEQRLDYGPLLTMLGELFPSPDDRRNLLWSNPARLLGFGS